MICKNIRALSNLYLVLLTVSCADKNGVESPDSGFSEGVWLLESLSDKDTGGFGVTPNVTDFVWYFCEVPPLQ